MLSSSPMLANNPQLQEQMRTMMPQFLQQMQNPEMLAMMSNPQALNAILQIQQSMEQLSQVAPGLVGSFGVPPPPPGANTTTPSTATPAAAPGLAPGQNPAQQQLFTDFMTRMLNGMSNQTAGNQNQRPEERYSAQLEQLTAMGFVNREANLQG